MVCCCGISSAFAQSGEKIWRSLTAQEAEEVSGKKKQLPWKETFEFFLDPGQLKAILNRSARSQSKSNTYLSLPLGDGKEGRFRLVPAPVMPEGLARKFPAIQTFKGISTDGRAYNARFSWTGKGFHGLVTGPEGAYFIDPHPSGKAGVYIGYDLRNNVKPGRAPALQCGADDKEDEYNAALQAEMVRMFLETAPAKSSALNHRKYTIAVAATGEYTAYHGGTVEGAMEAIVIIVNRLNLVLERDMGILLELAEGNDEIIFLDAENDPYTNGDASKMLEENANYLSVGFGSQKYDLGHVLGTNTSLNGIAYTGVVCVNTIQKAGGVSTMPNPEGDPFAIAIFGHEVGHQFGASHTFSSCHNIFQPTSYEPGGGTTIMSYAGICSDPVNNLQSTADDYFHTISLQQMLFLTREGSGRSCAELSPTNNAMPEVMIPQEDGFYIPVSTPFKLTADGTDPNPEDSLTYCWEQFDLGPVNKPPGSPEGNSPLFRSMPPKPDPTRYFPALEKVRQNEYDRSEVMPAYDRNLTFRCTVRDNNVEAGAVNWDEIRFKSTSSAGPFKVMTPGRSGLQWTVGELREIEWDVANTDNELVNCQYVNILLSSDGGQTFDRVLAQNTPNDGSAMVVIPNIITQSARIMVEAADNIFFDLADFNFEIWPPTKPGYFLNVTPFAIPQVCLPEPAEYTITYNSLMNFDDSISFNLVGDLPKGAVVEFSQASVVPDTEMNEVKLKIYLEGDISDTFDLQLQIATAQLDTAYRDIRLITKSNDYSGLEKLAPLNGERGVNPLLADFSWSSVPDAESYTFQIASNPAFGDSIIFSASRLTDTTFTLGNQLEPNGIYYWRIRGDNPVCGSGDFLEPDVFQTISSACRTYRYQGEPINISGTGLPTVKSTMSIAQGGVIEDVNIPIIDVNYQPIKSLRFTLISPEEDTVVLYDQSCGNTIRFLAGFDDQANGEIICPPDDKLPFRPLDSLAKFNGSIAAGDWTLEVKVVKSGFGASGGLSTWAIEFCSELNPVPPALVVKDTLKTAPGIDRSIGSNLLLFADPEFNDAELTYTLFSLPANGILLLDQDTLNIGDIFTQEDINIGRLRYAHSDNNSTNDQFRFIISNPEGGWVGVEQFDILIDESFLTNTREWDTQPQLKVFPNPADRQLTIQFEPQQLKNSRLHIFDGLGRMVLQQKLDGNGADNRTISTADWSEGLYVLQIRNEKKMISRKIIISHTP